MTSQGVARNADRLARASELLELKYGFFRFRDLREDALPDESTTYEETQSYKEELADYFRYRLDYFPLFDQEGSLNPLRWVYYADLHDEIVEEYFKRDFDIRSNVTAYRIATQHNQWRHIVRKRVVQLSASIGLYMALLVIPQAVESLAAMMNSAHSPTLHVWRWNGAFYLACWALAAVVIAAALRIHEWAIEYYSTRLRDAFEVNATNLSKKIQHRFANLVQNYTSFTRNLSEEEFNTSELDNREWIERCSWWVKMAMWNAKRIEYCEKFFQSEMQRLRIFIYVTNPLGNLSAIMVSAVLLVIPLFVTQAFLSHAGASAGADIWDALIGRSPPGQATGALQLAFVWLGALGTFAFARRSTLPKHSILLSDIRKWIAEHEWKRFADIGLHDEIANMIRRDKDRIRQEKMRGGYGTGHNRGGPL